MVLGNEVRWQRIASFCRFQEHDDSPALALAREQKEHPVVIGRHGSQEVQLQMVGKEHFYMSEDEKALPLQFTAQKSLKGFRDVCSCWFGAFRFVGNKSTKLVVGNRLQDLAVHIQWLGKPTAVVCSCLGKGGDEVMELGIGP